ncbi:ClpXP protease specificity-enhancing factor [Candidatus Hoaglandella endobia]|uniref:Stringent starvation protein B n=1 Tax=Candidatus Hoaglandella endobia TaxID=1778263 RepID=A0A143WVT8_9ENTR|nr:ClpXP protease specificity-enhancing factor [Candidatus Hoaglandella endobia]CUX97034.1 Stringent starvation protein B [Candidatus Hoaglandella endobia]
MKITQLLPCRPYLLRAFYEWLLDNQLTPHLLVDITVDRVMVPIEFARNGQIVLNVAPHAVANLALDNDEVRFHASFGGIPRQVIVPIPALLAIYASENGAGMMFEPESASEQQALSVISSSDRSADTQAEAYEEDEQQLTPPRASQPLLRLVK